MTEYIEITEKHIENMQDLVFILIHNESILKVINALKSPELNLIHRFAILRDVNYEDMQRMKISGFTLLNQKRTDKFIACSLCFYNTKTMQSGTIATISDKDLICVK